MAVMTEHNWSNNEGVKHFCACHPGPNSKLRKRDVENSSFAKSYRLLGVPTLVLIDREGRKMWNHHKAVYNQLKNSSSFFQATLLGKAEYLLTMQKHSLNIFCTHSP